MKRDKKPTHFYQVNEIEILPTCLLGESQWKLLNPVIA